MSNVDPFAPPAASLSSGGDDDLAAITPPPSPSQGIDFHHADERDADEFIAAAGATPLRVAAVAIRGLQRTRRAIVERELSNLGRARTLDEVRRLLLEDWENLSTLGVFSAVELVLDECSPPVPGACRVVATFAERPRLSLNTGTYVQGTEGSVELLASLLNSAGRAERLTLAFEKGSRQLDEASLTLERRRPWGYPCSFDAGIHQRSRSWAPTASFDETSRSFSAGVASADGKHALAYELAWRSLADATRRASASVKSQAGNSLKSALRYTRRMGGTVGEGCREEGVAARATVEVAGVGAGRSGGLGDGGVGGSLVRHVRNQVAATLLRRVSEGACLELTAEAGVLLPWGGAVAGRGQGSGAGGGGGSGRKRRPPAATPTTSISDRFFLGGVGGGLRGFAIRAVGPTDRRHGPGTATPSAAASPSPSSSTSPRRPFSTPSAPSATATGASPLSSRAWDLAGASAARAEAERQRAEQAAAASSSSVVDFVGADLAVSVLAALRFELPWKGLRDVGIFGHVFANGAGMALLGGSDGRGTRPPSAASSAASSPAATRQDIPLSRPPSLSSGLSGALASAAAELCSTWRWSAGAGFVWPTRVGNLEVDLVKVISAQPNDLSRTGLTLGFAPRV